MMSPRLLFLRCGFVVALIAVFGASLFPVPEGVDLSGGGDKVGHFLVFFALALAGLAAWNARPWVMTIGLLGYGCAIEVAQSTTASRQGDVLDWGADALGVFAALVIRFVIRGARGRSRTQGAG